MPFALTFVSAFCFCTDFGVTVCSFCFYFSGSLQSREESRRWSLAAAQILLQQGDQAVWRVYILRICRKPEQLFESRWVPETVSRFCVIFVCCFLFWILCYFALKLVYVQEIRLFILNLWFLGFPITFIWIKLIFLESPNPCAYGTTTTMIQCGPGTVLSQTCSGQQFCHVGATPQTTVCCNKPGI